MVYSVGQCGKHDGVKYKCFSRCAHLREDQGGKMTFILNIKMFSLKWLNLSTMSGV